MSDDEKMEERRKESRKDDVKNLIKVCIIRYKYLTYQILQLADLFHNDPNFDVQVNIQFKNSGDSNNNLNLLQQMGGAHSRKLSQTDLKNIVYEKPQRALNQKILNSRPERRLLIDSHKPKLDMNKFKMPENLY